MKNATALAAVSLFLAGCAGRNPAPQIMEVTRIVEVTQAQTPQNTPAPENPRMEFPAECLTPQAGIDFGIYETFDLDLIGWCSFVEPSPDGRFLAYSTMTCISESDPMLCGEAVKVLEINARDAVQVHFIPAGSKRLVWGLEWSSTGDLAVIQTDINHPVDTWVISQPFTNTLNPMAKAIIPGGLKKWNGPRTAFYTVLYDGPVSCGSLVSGYDFTSGKIFPDIAEILRLSNLKVQVYREMWWEGEASILLMITPLEFDEERGDEKTLPTILGKITLTPSGPQYTTIAESRTEDYYFGDAEGGDYSVNIKPYTAHYCREDEGR
jgi:hypothetical protein